jgi:undecaprenyl-diphosphatase
MNALYALILGIIQGLTEFIPVSSSGHLVIAHQLLEINETGLAFDVALHLGTLLALVLYFYKDIWQLLLGLCGKNDYTKLSRLLILATIPAVVSGVLLESAAESTFRSVRLVSLNLILVALLMLWAERQYAHHKDKTALQQTRTTQALSMGLAQAAAIVPGVSRSGSTITAGLFVGLDRVAATRFSFLLGIPITAGAILKVFFDSSAQAEFSGQMGIVAIGVMSAFVTGLLAIRFLLKYLAKHSLAMFAYYRIVLAVLVLLVVSLR